MKQKVMVLLVLLSNLLWTFKSGDYQLPLYMFQAYRLSEFAFTTFADMVFGAVFVGQLLGLYVLFEKTSIPLLFYSFLLVLLIPSVLLVLLVMEPTQTGVISFLPYLLFTIILFIFTFRAGR